jgi:predicted outer membrane repeat protein
MFGGTVTISNSTFTGNSGTSGGALILLSGANGVVERSTFTGNSANIIRTSKDHCGGGAVYNMADTLSLINCTFTQNSSYNGGAIFAGSGTMAIIHATVAENTGETGAGLYIGKSIVLINSVISDNMSPGNNCYLKEDASIMDGGGNLRFPYTDNTCTGSYGDPILSFLGFNGGDTMTMALNPGSAAIGMIPGENGCGCGVYTDQRGMPRPAYDGRCSSGAYEYRTGSSSSSNSLCFISTAS